jgi:flagellar M-ring protein FliF
VSAIGNMWQGYPRRAKAGFIAGLILITGLAIWLGMWAYRTEYAVLFADLSTGDASAMVTELDRTKTPYQLTDNGRTILVPKDLVYKTRLNVMGKELPLHGAVGFEVFNNADFGMTEFVQKVNYQRAIQGELTRTILSIEDVQSARVHLAIPEQGLFKKAQTKAKASATLVMKPGRTLVPAQITGIQRLIAASVPDILAADVTLLDQHGLPLTKLATADGAVESTGSQLDSKRSVEDYLLKKVTQVLDNMFGAGTAMASVDVVLNLDSDRITTEDVLPARSGPADGVSTGVVVRERQTIQGGAAAASAGNATAPAAGAGSGNTTVESDYQVGRRVQQVSVAPGGTRRMTVAVVIKKPMTPAQLEYVKEVVSLSLGLNLLRGDAIVVQSMDQLINSANFLPLPVVAEASPAVVAPIAPTQAADDGATSGETLIKSFPVLILMLVLLAVVIIGVIVWVVIATVIATSKPRRRHPQRFGTAMSQVERDRLLGEVKQWIIAGAEPGIEVGKGERR